MKKMLCFILSVLVAVNVYIFMGKGGREEVLASEISGKLIRFHVIANSDLDSDQALKENVKNHIIEYIFPKLRGSSSIEESRGILNSYNEQILKVAENTIRESGYQYTVTSTLGRENFPEKSYGNLTLPQGEYEAYRVVIGSGQGRNWWCVMFPPLCFVDVTRGQVSDKETEDTMKKSLSDEELKKVTKENAGESKIKPRFKVIEVVKGIMKK